MVLDRLRKPGNSQPTRINFGFLLDNPQTMKRRGTWLAVIMSLKVWVNDKSLELDTKSPKIAMSWFKPIHLIQYHSMRPFLWHAFRISVALFQGCLWIELFWGDSYKPVTQCECWQCIWTMSHGVLHQYSPGHHDWTQKPSTRVMIYIGVSTS